MLAERYVAGKRWYETPDGLMPSVTTVLAWGKRHDDGIQRWRERVGEEAADLIASESREVGTAMHAAIESDLLLKPRGVLQSEWLHLQRRLDALMASIDPFVGELEPVTLETPMHSKVLRLAGRCDCVARVLRLNGRLAIVDFKNSLRPKQRKWITDYFLQLAAYGQMYREMYGPVEDGIVAIAVVGHPVQAFQIKLADYTPQIKALADEFHSDPAHQVLNLGNEKGQENADELHRRSAS